MKAILRVSWRLYNIILIHINDCARYIRYSQCVFNKTNKAALEAAITRRYHGLEKGLSFTVRKKNFGKQKIHELIEHLERYIDLYGESASTAVSNSIIALKYYVNTKATNDNELVKRIDDLLRKDVVMHHVKSGEPTLSFTRAELQNSAIVNFEELCMNRHSIREYTTDLVSHKDIKKAIRMAQRSPSACNRQSVRCYYTCDNSKIDLLNKFKPGNMGFQNLGTVIFITTDFNSHDLSEERHQGFIEAGMFAMTLIYSLQYLGLGTCALHASFKPSVEKRLLKDFGIKEKESLCIMVSVGHLPKEISVASSVRYPLEEVCRNLDK